MVKKLALAVFSIFFLCRVSPAAVNFDNLSSNTLKEESDAFAVPVPAPSAVETPARPVKEWTVMLYSTTKDKLRYSLMAQLLEMKKIGSTGKVNALIEASVPVRHSDGSVSTSTIRMALGKAGDQQELDRLIADMGRFMDMDEPTEPIDESVLAPFAGDIVRMENSSDTGDWRKAADFTAWAKTNYPAKRYAFAIVGHGNGIMDYSKPATKGVLADAETWNYVSLPEMRLLMEKTGKTDIFIMNSCLMQMAEVAYQVKDHTDAVVGSSDYLWDVGYDFGGMLALLDAEPAIKSGDLGAWVADSLIARIKAEKLPGGHASVLLTSKLPAFVKKLDAWVEAELALKDKPALAEGVKNAARFDTFNFIGNSPEIAREHAISGDLYDFVSLVTAATPRGTPEQALAREKGAELMEFISDELIYKYSFTGPAPTGFDYARAHGLAIHIPPVKEISGFGLKTRFLKQYLGLPFAKESGWGTFLSWYYANN